MNSLSALLDWHWWLLGPVGLGWADWWQLFLRFLGLSLLSVGGAITTAPEMQRYIVGQRGWLTDADFTASVAVAQAAPGPNVLFVAVIGWNVGGAAGVLATLVGTLLPSSLLTLRAARFVRVHRTSRGLGAFNTGMTPITLGLLAATSWVLLQPAVNVAPLASALLVAGTLVFMLRTRFSPLWPVAAGAVLGAFGLLG